MGKVVAIMFTFTTYGNWLQGNSRNWVKRGIIYPGMPVLEKINLSNLKHKPYLFQKTKLEEIGKLMGFALTEKLNIKTYALTVNTWHSHFIVGQFFHSIGNVVKVVKSTVRSGLREKRPIWTDKYDKRFCFTENDVLSRVKYIQKHNLDNGLPANPWDFILPISPRSS